MPNRPPLAKNSAPLKMPSPSEASVSGQSPATAPRRGEPPRLVVGHVGRVDQAPARVDAGIVEQPVRPASSSAPRCSPRPPWSARRRGCGSARRHARRPRRAAPPASRRAANAARCRRARRAAPSTIARERATSAAKRSGSLRKRRWPVVRRRAAEAAVDIEARAAASARCRSRRGRGDARRHLAEVGVRPPVDVVMQVVEFADRREAGLQHLHVGEGRDRLDVVRRQRGRGSGTSPRARSRSCRAPGRAARRGPPCRAGTHGSAGSAGRGSRGRRCARAPSRGASGVTRVIVPSATSTRTSRAQPAGSRAWSKNSASHGAHFVRRHAA